MTDRDAALEPKHGFYNPPTIRDDLLLPESAAPDRNGRRLPYQPPPELSPKQRMFVVEYLRDFSSTNAAVRAGYHKDHASALMKEPLVAAAIEAAIAERSARVGLSTEYLLEHLGKIVRGDPRQLFDEEGRLLPPDMIPDDALVLIAGVKTRKIMQRNANGDFEPAEIQEVKFVDNLSATQLAMKHLGMLTEKKEITINDNRANRMAEARKRIKGRTIEAEFTEVKDEPTSLPALDEENVEDYL